MYFGKDVVFLILRHIPYFERLELKLVSKMWNKIIKESYETSEDLEIAFFNYRKEIPIFCKCSGYYSSFFPEHFGFCVYSKKNMNTWNWNTREYYMSMHKFTKLRVYSTLFVKYRIKLFQEHRHEIPLFECGEDNVEIKCDKDNIVLYYENEKFSAIIFGYVAARNDAFITVKLVPNPLFFVSGDVKGIEYYKSRYDNLNNIEELVYLTQKFTTKVWFDRFSVEHYNVNNLNIPCFNIYEVRTKSCKGYKISKDYVCR